MSKNHRNNAYSLVDERTTTYENPFKFTAKELDDITGLYDHGARSRNPMSTLWYGIDPLFEMYTDMSPYAYCHANPIRFIDPTGMFDTEEEARSFAKNNKIENYEIQKEKNGLYYVYETGENAKHCYYKPKDSKNIKIEDIKYVTTFSSNKLFGDLSGSSDPANMGGKKEGGSFTKQDVTVATAVIGVMVGGVEVLVAVAAGSFALTDVITIVGIINSVDDLGTNSKGESLTQQLVITDNAKNNIGRVKLIISTTCMLKSSFDFKKDYSNIKYISTQDALNIPPATSASINVVDVINTSCSTTQSFR